MSASKITLMVLCIVLCVSLAIMVINNGKLKKQKAELEGYYNQTTGAILEIQDSLEAINTKEMMIHMIATNPEIGDSAAISERDKILNSIQNIDNYIQQNKIKLDKLEKEMQRKTLRISGMGKLINKLKKQIADKEAMIIELRNQVDSLTQTIRNEREKALQEIAVREDTITEQGSTINAQNETIDQQTEMINKQNDLLNTVYYAIGVKKQLIDSGYLDKGGIFTKAKMNTSFNSEKMLSINVAKESDISISAGLKKIKILTAQNTNSYILKPESANVTILKITNPEEFRKIKYLLIQLD